MTAARADRGPEGAPTARAAQGATQGTADGRVDDGGSLEAYRHTVLEFCGGGLRVDLRRPLDEAIRGALAARGLGAGFAVLTAENPCGEHQEDAPAADEARALARANGRRTSRLIDELIRAGTPFERVDGVAPGGDHRERCVAVPADRAAAIALARKWDQLALFWYDGDSIWLLSAEADEAPVRLP